MATEYGNYMMAEKLCMTHPEIKVSSSEPRIARIGTESADPVNTFGCVFWPTDSKSVREASVQSVANSLSLG